MGHLVVIPTRISLSSFKLVLDCRTERVRIFAFQDGQSQESEKLQAELLSVQNMWFGLNPQDLYSGLFMEWMSYWQYIKTSCISSISVILWVYANRFTDNIAFLVVESISACASMSWMLPVNASNTTDFLRTLITWPLITGNNPMEWRREGREGGKGGREGREGREDKLKSKSIPEQAATSAFGRKV